MEIFFSILQRKVRTPNDYGDLAALARTLNEFKRRWNEVAEPFGGTSPATISPS